MKVFTQMFRRPVSIKGLKFSHTVYCFAIQFNLGAIILERVNHLRHLRIKGSQYKIEKKYS